jgi:hypothetical protein
VVAAAAGGPDYQRKVRYGGGQGIEGFRIIPDLFRMNRPGP